MPTRPIRRSIPAAPTPIEVQLSDREGVRIAREVLGITDPARRLEVLKDFELILSKWARALLNVPNVRLRSDLLARARPLAARAETFWQVMLREPDVLSYAGFKGYVDFQVLSKQLQGFHKLVEWINEEKSKRGGERRAFRKQTNDEWRAHVHRWFVPLSRRLSKTEKAKRESQIMRIAQTAVERALRLQKSSE